MKINVKTMTVIAMLAVLAFLVTLVCHFAMPLLVEEPPLKLDLKDAIITMAGFMLGPVEALFITVVAAFLELVFISPTGLWGFLMNVLSSAMFSCWAALIYRRVHSRNGALVSLLTGVILMTGTMLVWNYLITPLYMGMPRADVAKLLVPAFLPFNLIKGALHAALVMLLYKPVVTALRRANLIPKSESSAHGGARTYGVIAAIAAAVIAGCVLAVLAIRGVI